MVNKEHLQEWRDHPITEMLVEVIKERIGEGLEALAASDDPDLDRKIKGMIHGFREVLEWEPEVVINVEDQESESRTPSFD